MNKKNLLLLMLLTASHSISAQSIVSWTEENGTLGLGYPVPVPVDTPEPFDGFRTYTGLFAKHQAITQSNPHVTGHVVGQTHYDRDIWAYVLSDADTTTLYGVAEGNMLMNGGIHAREWQSPEVVTGIMELFDANADDQFMYQYLLENTAIVLIPVNNVDGFLQTQRFPADNWLGTDPFFEGSPRDGRMRRKNMLDVDENLNTQDDHLLGVDLNRNNLPYWSFTVNFDNPRSSNDNRSLIHHGAFAHSEPETLARLAAAELVDTDHLRVYTDVHSFSELFFSSATNNASRNILQSRLLTDFRTHHQAFPAGKIYEDVPGAPNVGIGATDEYFAETYQIPSFTMEIEPSPGTQNQPGGSADYGGFANNGNDGFILPESEIRRVREQLAESFAVMWYGQAGPPAISRVQIIEKISDAVVQDYEWDLVDSQNQNLYINDVENLIPGNEYTLMISFNKPMRTRNGAGAITNLQGQNLSLNPSISASAGSQTLNLNLSNDSWLNEKTAGWRSYQHYKEDSFVVDFVMPELPSGNSMQWTIRATDMIGQVTDANPATVVTWADGRWANYENSNGTVTTVGGNDTSYSSPVSSETRSIYSPQVAGSALLFNPDRLGEGIIVENLEGNRNTIQYYTYDDEGNQRWFYGTGIRSGNRIVTDNFPTSSGGVFGPGHQSDQVQLLPTGQVELTFSAGTFSDDPARISRTTELRYTAPDGSILRTTLQPLSLVEGQAELLPTPGVPGGEELSRAAGFSGTWFDEALLGKGYHLEILLDGRALIIWYDYTPDGQQAWILDADGTVTETETGISISFDNLVITEGGFFGDALNPDNVELIDWGSATMQLTCEGGTFSFSPTLVGYNAGQYNVQKLTSLAGLDCQ